MPPGIRLICALAAFPAGWAVREAAGGAAGGTMVLALIAASAAGLPRGVAAAVVVTGVVCFAGLHLLAGLTGVYPALAIGALLFAVASWRWATSSSSAPRGTPAT